MKVILLKDVEKVGKSGEVIVVKDGFARNFLILKNLATPANDAALKNLKLQQETLVKRLEKDKIKAQELAKQVSAISCTIPVVAGEEDKLYGSVTSQDIVEALKQEKIELDKRDIIIEEPINKLGVYQVKVKLHPEVEANVRIWVVKK